MTAKLYVQVWQDGVCLQEVPFTGDRLQVGRLPDNDVVINHLSVSRTHALLERDGDLVAVQDLGSQNGVWADGQRVESRVSFPVGSSVRIGQHELRFTSAESSVVAEAATGESELSAPAEGLLDSEAEDALASFAIDEDELGESELGVLPAGTELSADDLFGSGDEGGSEDEGTHLVDEGSPQVGSLDVSGADSTAVDAISAPDFAGEEEPLSIPSLGDDAGLPAAETAEEEAFLGAPDSAVLDAGVLEDLSPGEESSAPMVGSPFDDTQGSGEAPMYAGLIVQRGGALESVLPWESDEMFAGRGSECEILLAEPEVSRKHAVFVRTAGGGYLVRDLGSINGVFVNDEKVDERDLAVGDIVRIESFALTFLLDHQPIGNEVQLPEPAAPGPAADQERGHMTVLGELPPLDAPAINAPSGAPVPSALPSLDLLDTSLDGSLDESLDPDAKSDDESPLRLELEVSMDELPESLRRVLRELGDQVLHLPVNLRVRR